MVDSVRQGRRRVRRPVRGDAPIAVDRFFQLIPVMSLPPLSLKMVSDLDAENRGLIDQKRAEKKRGQRARVTGVAEVFLDRQQSNSLSRPCRQYASMLREHWHVWTVYESRPIANGFG
jgi:hypothetical protein